MSSSVKNLFARNLGLRMRSEDVKKITDLQIRRLFPDTEMRTVILASVGIIRHLETEISGIEKMILKKLKIRKKFAKLMTIPGVGTLLALTIMLEVGDIRRFPTVGDYSSYSRCEKSIRTSAGKIVGYGNRRNGNKYLSWAYVEAAQAARRFHEAVRAYYEKKMARTNRIVAIKALKPQAHPGVLLCDAGPGRVRPCASVRVNTKGSGEPEVTCWPATTAPNWRRSPQKQDRTRSFPRRGQVLIKEIGELCVLT